MSNSHDKSDRFSLEATRQLPQDDVESARILMNEGLLEEARKMLFRVLANKPDFQAAKELLKKVEALELKEIFRDPVKQKKYPPAENASAIIDALEKDLGLSRAQDGEPMWIATSSALSPKELFDLGIAFYEMGCYGDALRELNRAEKKIRIEESFLGDLGVAVVALTAQCLVNLNRVFDAKIFLEPVLSEADLRHEDKLTLYYTMGVIEQELDQKQHALGWFQRVAESDADFKDVQVRLKQLNSKAPPEIP